MWISPTWVLLTTQWHISPNRFQRGNRRKGLQFFWILYFRSSFVVLTLEWNFKMTPLWSVSTYSTLLWLTDYCLTTPQRVGRLKMCVTWFHALRSSRRPSCMLSGHIINRVSTHWISIFLTTWVMVWIVLRFFLYWVLTCTSTSIWCSNRLIPVLWSVWRLELRILCETKIVHLVGNNSLTLLSNKFSPHVRVVKRLLLLGPMLPWWWWDVETGLFFHSRHSFPSTLTPLSHGIVIVLYVIYKTHWNQTHFRSSWTW